MGIRLLEAIAGACSIGLHKVFGAFGVSNISPFYYAPQSTLKYSPKRHGRHVEETPYFTPAYMMASFGGGHSYVTENGTAPINIEKLDDMPGDGSVTLIKMDIEGFEPRALRGAERLVRRNRPALSKCVYHQIDHFWPIPLWIKEPGLGYSLSPGVHGHTNTEAICYAIPEEAVHEAGG